MADFGLPVRVPCLHDSPASPNVTDCAGLIHPLQSEIEGARGVHKEYVLTTKEETRVALTCPSCGNDQNFLVKTLQMHVVHLDDSRVEVSEEGRPVVLELLCDECEVTLKLEDIDDSL